MGLPDRKLCKKKTQKINKTFQAILASIAKEI